MGDGVEITIGIFLIAATLTDLLWGKIYNFLTFPFFLGGLLYQFSVLGLRAGGKGLLAGLLAFAILFPLYQLRGIAAGDVKLLMAVGAWTTPRFVLELLGYAVIVGGIVAVVFLIQRVGFRKGLKSLREHLGRGPKKGHLMPFGPAFLCSFVILKICERYQWSLF